MVPRAMLLAALASLLAAPFVSAQGPSDPNPTLTLTVTPASGTVNPGGSTTYQLSVALSMTQPLMCTGAATAEVTLSYADNPAPLNGLTGTLSATTVSFPVANAPGPLADGFTGEAQTVHFNVTATPNVTPNHDHAFNFTAFFDGDLGACAALHPNPVPERTATREATLRTGGQSTGTGSPTGTGTDSTGTDSTDSEAAPHLGVAGLALALAFAARRKLK